MHTLVLFVVVFARSGIMGCTDKPAFILDPCSYRLGIV
jgi:hypothetical protein